MSHSEIKAVLERSEQDGSLGMFFFGEDPDKDAFVRRVTGYEVTFFTIFCDDTPVGFGMLDQFRYQSAHGHFCVFKDWWGNPTTVDVAKKVYLYLLQTFSVLIGIIPETNIHAFQFCTKTGMKNRGMVPQYFFDGHEYTDGVLFTISRGD